ncbi:hypothetical protein ADUPG1_007438, partial [Aduncisulcus paluster]
RTLSSKQISWFESRSRIIDRTLPPADLKKLAANFYYMKSTGKLSLENLRGIISFFMPSPIDPDKYVRVENGTERENVQSCYYNPPVTSSFSIGGFGGGFGSSPAYTKPKKPSIRALTLCVCPKGNGDMDISSIWQPLVLRTDLFAISGFDMKSKPLYNKDMAKLREELAQKNSAGMLFNYNPHTTTGVAYPAFSKKMIESNPVVANRVVYPRIGREGITLDSLRIKNPNHMGGDDTVLDYGKSESEQLSLIGELDSTYKDIDVQSSVISRHRFLFCMEQVYSVIQGLLGPFDIGDIRYPFRCSPSGDRSFCVSSYSEMSEVEAKIAFTAALAFL